MTPKQNFRGGILGGLGGSIFGSTAWLARMSMVTEDVTTLTIIIVLAIVLYIVSIKICFAKPSSSWTVIQWTVVAVCILNLAVVNLRWEHWMANPVAQNHLLSPGITLTHTNLILGGVFGALTVMFFVMSKTIKKQFIELELQQMQIKDL